ncbi:MAG: helix-turn-helix transcriptional regulator [Clostridia bacterium]|nr:helix-turn-helix transcriptional regulator [Clostridia bacterium]
MLNIKKYRKRLGMTQADVAQKLNVTKSAVSQYETGARNPDIFMLKKLSDILECTADELLETINS